MAAENRLFGLLLIAAWAVALVTSDCVYNPDIINLARVPDSERNTPQCKGSNYGARAGCTLQFRCLKSPSEGGIGYYFEEDKEGDGIRMTCGADDEWTTEFNSKKLPKCLPGCIVLTDNDMENATYVGGAPKNVYRNGDQIYWQSDVEIKTECKPGFIFTNKNLAEKGYDDHRCTGTVGSGWHDIINNKAYGWPGQCQAVCDPLDSRSIPDGVVQINDPERDVNSYKLMPDGKKVMLPNSAYQFKCAEGFKYLPPHDRYGIQTISCIGGEAKWYDAAAKQGKALPVKCVSQGCAPITSSNIDSNANVESSSGCSGISSTKPDGCVVTIKCNKNAGASGTGFFMPSSPNGQQLTCSNGQWVGSDGQTVQPDSAGRYGDRCTVGCARLSPNGRSNLVREPAVAGRTEEVEFYAVGSTIETSCKENYIRPGLAVQPTTPMIHSCESNGWTNTNPSQPSPSRPDSCVAACEVPTTTQGTTVSVSGAKTSSNGKTMVQEGASATVSCDDKFKAPASDGKPHQQDLVCVGASSGWKDTKTEKTNEAIMTCVRDGAVGCQLVSSQSQPNTEVTTTGDCRPIDGLMPENCKISIKCKEGYVPEVSTPVTTPDGTQSLTCKAGHDGYVDDNTQSSNVSPLRCEAACEVIDDMPMAVYTEKPQSGDITEYAGMQYLRHKAQVQIKCKPKSEGYDFNNAEDMDRHIETIDYICLGGEERYIKEHSGKYNKIPGDACGGVCDAVGGTETNVITEVRTGLDSYVFHDNAIRKVVNVDYHVTCKAGYEFAKGTPEAEKGKQVLSCVGGPEGYMDRKNNQTRSVPTPCIPVVVPKCSALTSVNTEVSPKEGDCTVSSNKVAVDCVNTIKCKDENYPASSGFGAVDSPQTVKCVQVGETAQWNDTTTNMVAAPLECNFGCLPLVTSPNVDILTEPAPSASGSQNYHKLGTKVTVKCKAGFVPRADSSLSPTGASQPMTYTCSDSTKGKPWRNDIGQIYETSPGSICVKTCSAMSADKEGLKIISGPKEFNIISGKVVAGGGKYIFSCIQGYEYPEGSPYANGNQQELYCSEQEGIYVDLQDGNETKATSTGCKRTDGPGCSDLSREYSKIDSSKCPDGYKPGCTITVTCIDGYIPTEPKYHKNGKQELTCPDGNEWTEADGTTAKAAMECLPGCRFETTNKFTVTRASTRNVTVNEVNYMRAGDFTTIKCIGEGVVWGLDVTDTSNHDFTCLGGDKNFQRDEDQTLNVTLGEGCIGTCPALSTDSIGNVLVTAPKLFNHEGHQLAADKDQYVFNCDSKHTYPAGTPASQEGLEKAVCNGETRKYVVPATGAVFNTPLQCTRKTNNDECKKITQDSSKVIESTSSCVTVDMDYYQSGCEIKVKCRSGMRPDSVDYLVPTGQQILTCGSGGSGWKDQNGKQITEPMKCIDGCVDPSENEEVEGKEYSKTVNGTVVTSVCTKTIVNNNKNPHPYYCPVPPPTTAISACSNACPFVTLATGVEIVKTPMRLADEMEYTFGGQSFVLRCSRGYIYPAGSIQREKHYQTLECNGEDHTYTDVDTKETDAKVVACVEAKGCKLLEMNDDVPPPKEENCLKFDDSYSDNCQLTFECRDGTYPADFDTLLNGGENVTCREHEDRWTNVHNATVTEVPECIEGCYTLNYTTMINQLNKTEIFVDYANFTDTSGALHECITSSVMKTITDLLTRLNTINNKYLCNNTLTVRNNTVTATFDMECLDSCRTIETDPLPLGVELKTSPATFDPYGTMEKYIGKGNQYVFQCQAGFRYPKNSPYVTSKEQRLICNGDGSYTDTATKLEIRNPKIQACEKEPLCRRPAIPDGTEQINSTCLEMDDGYRTGCRQTLRCKDGHSPFFEKDYMRGSQTLECRENGLQQSVWVDLQTGKEELPFACQDGCLDKDNFGSNTRTTVTIDGTDVVCIIKELTEELKRYYCNSTESNNSTIVDIECLDTCEKLEVADTLTVTKQFDDYIFDRFVLNGKSYDVECPIGKVFNETGQQKQRFRCVGDNSYSTSQKNGIRVVEDSCVPTGKPMCKGQVYESEHSAMQTLVTSCKTDSTGAVEPGCFVTVECITGGSFSDQSRETSRTYRCLQSGKYENTVNGELKEHIDDECSPHVATENKDECAVPEDATIVVDKTCPSTVKKGCEIDIKCRIGMIWSRQTTNNTDTVHSFVCEDERKWKDEEGTLKETIPDICEPTCEVPKSTETTLALLVCDVAVKGMLRPDCLLQIQCVNGSQIRTETTTSTALFYCGSDSQWKKLETNEILTVEDICEAGDLLTTPSIDSTTTVVDTTSSSWATTTTPTPSTECVEELKLTGVIAAIECKTGYCEYKTSCEPGLIWTKESSKKNPADVHMYICLGDGTYRDVVTNETTPSITDECVEPEYKCTPVSVDNSVEINGDCIKEACTVSLQCVEGQVWDETSKSRNPDAVHEYTCQSNEKWKDVKTGAEYETVEDKCQPPTCSLGTDLSITADLFNVVCKKNGVEMECQLNIFCGLEYNSVENTTVYEKVLTYVCFGNQSTWVEEGTSTIVSVDEMMQGCNATGGTTTVTSTASTITTTHAPSTVCVDKLELGGVDATVECKRTSCEYKTACKPGLIWTKESSKKNPADVHMYICLGDGTYRDVVTNETTPSITDECVEPEYKCTPVSVDNSVEINGDCIKEACTVSLQCVEGQVWDETSTSRNPDAVHEYTCQSNEKWKDVKTGAEYETVEDKCQPPTCSLGTNVTTKVHFNVVCEKSGVESECQLHLFCGLEYDSADNRTVSEKIITYLCYGNQSSWFGSESSTSISLEEMMQGCNTTGVISTTTTVGPTSASTLPSTTTAITTTTANPITTPPISNSCNRLANLPVNDVCWHKWEGKKEGVCHEQAILKVESELEDRFTYGACDCNAETKGNGFFCQGSCTFKEQSVRECPGDLICGKYPNQTTYCGCPAGYNRNGEGQCIRTEDSCSTCRHSCHAASVCNPQNDVRIDSLYTCSNCNEELGFVGLNGNCKDIDECKANTHACDVNAKCVNKNPLAMPDFAKYVCNCLEGYTNNGKDGTSCNPCQDIDECQIANKCPENSDCTNTPGSYSCKCKKGFETKGSLCQDIDECVADPCAAQATCNNTVGSFSCKCKDGFVGDAYKNCQPDPSFCDNCNKTTTTCRLTSNGLAYECACKTHHKRIPGDSFNCEPDTYCHNPAATNCAPTPKAICIDRADGSGYDCKCAEGYRGNGTYCQNEDICIRQLPCADISGTRCVTDSNDKDKYKCVCLDNYIRQVADQHDDKKPCYDKSGPMVHNCTQCKPEEVCDETTDANIKKADQGTWMQCNCRAGYRKNVQNDLCLNIDECKEQTDDCDPIRAICIDLDPKEDDGEMYRCQCKRGYAGSGKKESCKDINECLNATGVDPCPQEHKECKNTQGSYECVCMAGFMELTPGGDCFDKDECTMPGFAPNCPVYSKCNNTVGGYGCVCMVGYREVSRVDGKNVTCEPIDQCVEGDVLTGEIPCDPVSERCQSSPPSYSCKCANGFKRENGVCQDVDECREDNSNECDRLTTRCNNTIGSYECVCADGFHRDEKSTSYICSDVEECLEGLSQCNVDSYCVNTVGAYKCVCDVGFSVVPGSHPLRPYCQRDSICEKNPSKCHAGQCIDTTVDPFFECKCTVGTISFNDTICIDQKYCDVSNHFVCPPNSECQSNKKCNCMTGYKWKDLGPFYTLDDIKNKRECQEVSYCAQYAKSECGQQKCRDTGPGKGECYCDAGFDKINMGSLKECHDINECFNKTAPLCPPNSHCENTPGDYICNCDQGYAAQYPGSTEKVPICENINECDPRNPGMHNCTKHPNSECEDREGDFWCPCLEGYKRDQFGNGKQGDGSWMERECIDINECTENDPAPCDENADCNNTAGGFSCKCHDGFLGDGKPGNCRDIDECFLNTHNCTSPNETCQNTSPFWKCNCSEGFRLSGGKCIDINECLENKEACSSEEKMTCVNEIGYVNGNKGFFCECQDGFIMSINNTCVDIDECAQSWTVCPTGAGDYCNNTVGSFDCTCKKGYRKPQSCEKTPRTCQCEDIPECTEGRPNLQPWCGKNANCTEQAGSAKCDCYADHIGDPYDLKNGCKPVDVCEDLPCSHISNSFCVPSGKTFRCDCLKGYRKSGIAPDIECHLPSCENATVTAELHPTCECEESYNVGLHAYSGHCVCRSDMVKGTNDAGQEMCKDPDPCKCNGKQYPCQSEVCENERMECYQHNGDAHCRCQPHFLYNNGTKECDETNPCEKHDCPLEAVCRVLTDEKGVNQTFTCDCPKGQIYNEQLKKCVADPTCGGDNCAYKANSECVFNSDMEKYDCICTAKFEQAAPDICRPKDACTVWKMENPGKERCGANSVEDGEDRVNCKCVCLEGYVMAPNNTCIDENECKERSACASNITAPECINTVGSYQCVCGVLDKTMELFEGKCQPIDLCRGAMCDPNAKCNPSTGNCLCKEGYRMENKTCVNVNECSEKNYNLQCPQFSDCYDETPGYRCECRPGYETVVLGEGKYNFKCVNIVECLNETVCPDGSDCVDLPGDYRCDCKLPLIQYGPKDCASNTTAGCQCGLNAHCMRIHQAQVTFNCTCNAGYEGDAKKNCTDINECDDETHDCVEHAICRNTEPGHECDCEDGYHGDGKILCSLINFCERNSCPVESACKDLGLPEKYTCQCKNGFHYNKAENTCDDTDECEPCGVKDAPDCPCPKTALNCTNTIGSYICICPEGHEYNPVTNTCDNVNECLDEKVYAKTCPSTVGKCRDLPGSWQCDCNPSYANPPGKPQECVLDDYCGTPRDDCWKNTTTCVEMRPGFDCECKEGFHKENPIDKFCVDRNECLEKSDNCKSPQETCYNLVGSFVCNCTAGYERDAASKECLPLEKCPEECGVYSSCHRTRDASVSKCVCDEGYEPIANDDKNCIIKSCKDQNCPRNSECRVVQDRNETNVDEKSMRYECVCLHGYVMSPHQICVEPTEPCGADTCISPMTCSATTEPPFYKCVCTTPECVQPSCDTVTCPPNTKCYMGNCVCQDFYVRVNGVCEREKQCPTRKSECSMFATCHEGIEPGTINCTCNGPMYRGNGTYCIDVDECLEKLDDCHEYANCTNTQGGYNCDCTTGYVGKGTDCKDIDECNDNTHKCDVTTTDCRNTNGSYECECKEGFENRTYPYFQCYDIDECVNETICDIHICINQPATYICSCINGYRNVAGDNKKCENINECHEKTHSCHTPNARCEDTEGSYNCFCDPPKFEGDGRNNCSQVDLCTLSEFNRCDNSSTTCEMNWQHGTVTCPCLPGYHKPSGQSDPHSCNDNNECTDGSVIYDKKNTDCKNLPGTYELSCKTGYENKHPQPSKHNVDCQNLDECAMDPAYAETLEKIANAKASTGVNEKQWKDIMVPPKDNSSGYAYCYNYAAANGVWEVTTLPLCFDAQPEVEFSLRPKGIFGFGCGCFSVETNIDKSSYIHTVKCEGSSCNCNQDYGFECEASTLQCVCMNKTYVPRRVEEGVTKCVDFECESDYDWPADFPVQSRNYMRCEKNVWVASNGYKLVRDNQSAVIDAVDIDECTESASSPCCSHEESCVGDMCVKCVNTPGSYSCNSQKNDRVCATNNIDKNTCKCAKEECPTYESWFYRCSAPYYNVTGDPRFALPENNRPLCSRFLDRNGHLTTFNSLLDLYQHIEEMSKNVSVMYTVRGCMFDGNSDDLSTTPAFNYWGACKKVGEDGYEDIKCEKGEKDSTEINEKICQLKTVEFPMKHPVGMPVGQPYATTPVCFQSAFKDQFLTGYFVFDDTNGNIYPM